MGHDGESNVVVDARLTLLAEPVTGGPAGSTLGETLLTLTVPAAAVDPLRVPGTVAVAARTLFDIVKNLPDGEVSWSLSDSHAVEVKCGKVRYRIPAMPGEDFPPLPNPGDADFAHLEAEVLAELIGLTQYSMSHDDTRPHLAGTLFEGDGKLVRMVTTDGHRLSKAEKTIEGSLGGLTALVRVSSDPTI